MKLCEQLPQGFDFFLKQQSRISALQRQTPFSPLLLFLSPCLSDVTQVDFIHVHKGSPTLESPGRQLLSVRAVVTTTNKGQSPMVMANWVCSHYWSSELWSTDGGLASLHQVAYQPLENRALYLGIAVWLYSVSLLVCFGLYITSSYAASV